MTTENHNPLIERLIRIKDGMTSRADRDAISEACRALSPKPVDAREASDEARRFRNACMILMNLDLDELENAGVIRPGAVGGSSWGRFNKDPLIFIAKLDDDRYAALWALIEERQPARKGSAMTEKRTLQQIVDDWWDEWDRMPPHEREAIKERLQSGLKRAMERGGDPETKQWA